ncbi:hypothetical protein VE03_07710 [Pseudogymnoascus sp. 23342-1-I1]|nr:hypothetical protein VE03_07710 [Pseudogymnoascus sp. 23342-1-I1]
MAPKKVGISRGGLGSNTNTTNTTRVTRSQGLNQGGNGTAGPSTGGGANPYAPGTSITQLVTLAGPSSQRATSTPPTGASQIDPRPGESPASFERRRLQREHMSASQAARRARMRARVLAAEAAEGQEPKRKLARGEIVDRLNECSARVTRSAVERDEELGNCPHCARGQTWPRKCYGGDECIECEARGFTCVRGNKRFFDRTRERQMQGLDAWRPHEDQCRQCKSRGSQCWMPNMKLPGPCDQCRVDGLECDITPLPVRRCRNCHWEHKCIECASNQLRCDGQIPCFVCVRKGIQCAGLKPDGSCPDIHMAVYGTGLPPQPHRTTVVPSTEEKNWPPPSGRLQIPGNYIVPPNDQGIQPVISFGPARLSSPGPAPGPSSDLTNIQETLDPPLEQLTLGQETSPPVEAGPSAQGGPQDPGARAAYLSRFRTSLYNPFDDDKPPCSHCAADPENRICDQDTPCWECSLRGITEPEDCRTSRPCELCFMNELPCDAGSPCQHCMFLGFGADECRPEGISPQRYFPDDNPDDSDDEPYIHIPGADQVPEFQYSCAFCVAYGFQGCNPQDATCMACMQHGRTSLQCRFEQRCNRCTELDVPCDGKMPCSLCATADGLTSMMCLGRGDTSLQVVSNMPPENVGYDVPKGEGGDYPGFDAFGFQLPIGGANNPFDPADPMLPFIDPAILAANQGIPGQPILPQENVPLVPPQGFFYPPAHVRGELLNHYRIRTDVYNSGRFNPGPGAHVDWRPWVDFYRCRETLEDGMPCLKLPTMVCDGGEEHADDNWCVCEWCRKLAEERTAHLLEEIQEKKNLFCCSTCSQAQMTQFNNGVGLQNMETLMDHHCDCDAQMRAWLCYACRYKAIHLVGNRMIATRELLTRDSDNAILCPRCGVGPGNKEAAYTLANGVARCSSCWSWINYAR